MSLIDFPRPLSKWPPARHLLVVALLLCLSPGFASAQEQSVIEESDTILGKGALDGAQPAGPGRIGIADVRTVMLFHPLMQYLVSTYGNSPILYFLPPTASELTKLFDERRAKRLVEVRAEMTDLAGKTAKLQQELFGLKDQLNRGAGGAPQRKAEEEGFWKRKQELTMRLASMNERYAALSNEIQDPLKLLEQTRAGIVTKIRREVDEALARVAAAEKLGVVLNAYSPAKEPVEQPNQAAPEPGGVLAANEYKDFMGSKVGSDKVEPGMPQKRLLGLWEARGPKIESVFGIPAARTVLYGGTDITWPVLHDILVRYSVPGAQVALLKAHFEGRSQR